MWTQLLIGIGGLVFLATAYAGLHELANRRRVLGGECRMDSIRCLGCLATGRCHSQERRADSPNEPVRRNVADRTSTFNKR